MTPDELRARCRQFLESLRLDPANLLSDNMASTESLCREMIGVGLERATSGLKVDNTTLRWALKELGPTGTNAEAYIKVAVEHVIWAREEAQRVKDNHDTKKS